MNRAERRKMEKTNTKESVMERYRREAYDQGFTNGMQNVVDITFYLTAYTLSYKLELSKEELQQLMKAIYNNIDSFRSGHLEPRDYDTIVKQMREEYGIKID